MNEHGWPDDHHDHDVPDLDHHDDEVIHDDVPDLDAGLPDDDVWDSPDDPQPVEHHDVDLPYEHEPAAPADPELVDTDPHEMATVGADPDALPDTDDPVGVFPPVVDVGPLPEPVDGHPWIDTGSLGLVDPATVHAAAAPDPGELAAYAAEDLPPGADPWAALADSEDPATSALARFWAPPAGPGDAIS